MYVRVCVRLFTKADQGGSLGTSYLCMYLIFFTIHNS